MLRDGGWVFLMSEAPLYRRRARAGGGADRPHASYERSTPDSMVFMSKATLNSCFYERGTPRPHVSYQRGTPIMSRDDNR